jgi:hypothetical protein
MKTRGFQAENPKSHSLLRFHSRILVIMTENSALPLFSSQQTTRPPIPLSEFENRLRNIETNTGDKYWRQRDKTKGIVCNVVSVLGFPVSRGDEWLLELQDIPSNYSSEHVVFTADLHIKKAGCMDFVFTTEVVIKFRYIKIRDEKYVQNMDKDHCESIIKNYNDLHDYVKKFDLRGTIDVVPVCILRGITADEDSFLQGINLWVEQKIRGFTRFTNKAFCRVRPNEWIVSITFPALKDLQVKFMSIQIVVEQSVICKVLFMKMATSSRCVISSSRIRWKSSAMIV